MATVSDWPCRAGRAYTHAGPSIVPDGPRALICQWTALMLGSGTSQAARTTPSATASTTGRKIGILGIHASPFGSDSNRYALQHASLLVSRRVHAIIDGKVTTNQVGTHGSVFTCQDFRFVRCACLVFAVIDAGNASIAGPGAVGLVHGLRPLAASAQIYAFIVSLLFANTDRSLARGMTISVGL